MSGNYGAVLGKCMCDVGAFLGHSGEFRNVVGEFRVFFGVCNCVLKLGACGAIHPVEKNFFNILKGGTGGVRLQAGCAGQPCAHSLGKC